MTAAVTEEFVSRRTLVARRFARNRLAVISLAVLVALFVAAYALPPLLPYSHTDIDFAALQTPPSPQHCPLRRLPHLRPDRRFRTARKRRSGRPRRPRNPC